MRSFIARFVVAMAISGVFIYLYLERPEHRMALVIVWVVCIVALIPPAMIQLWRRHQR